LSGAVGAPASARHHVRISRGFWPPVAARVRARLRHCCTVCHFAGAAGVHQTGPNAVIVAARAAVARCAVTSLRCVRRSLHRMAACPRRRAAPVTVPAPVVAALPRQAGKQWGWPLDVETTGIFVRRVSIYIKTKLSWPLDRPLEQMVRTPYYFDGVFDHATHAPYCTLYLPTLMISNATSYIQVSALLARLGTIPIANATKAHTYRAPESGHWYSALRPPFAV
jgi:hypothetical protein